MTYEETRDEYTVKHGDGFIEDDNWFSNLENALQVIEDYESGHYAVPYTAPLSVVKRTTTRTESTTDWEDVQV